MSKLRLLKIIVQPVFVIDDGETLTEETGQAVAVPASQWKEWLVTFENELQRVQAEYEETESVDT